MLLLDPTDNGLEQPDYDLFIKPALPGGFAKCLDLLFFTCPIRRRHLELCFIEPKQ